MRRMREEDAREIRTVRSDAKTGGSRNIVAKGRDKGRKWRQKNADKKTGFRE